MVPTVSRAGQWKLVYKYLISLRCLRRLGRVYVLYHYMQGRGTGMGGRTPSSSLFRNWEWGENKLPHLTEVTSPQSPRDMDSQYTFHTGYQNGRRSRYGNVLTVVTSPAGINQLISQSNHGGGHNLDVFYKYRAVLLALTKPGSRLWCLW